jgi:hypothetical protein
VVSGDIPFFTKLASGSGSENYLSRVFYACFAESRAFADAVLSVIWEKCRLKGEPQSCEAWVCNYQPSPPAGGGIHPDLSLQEVSGRRTIFIESKLGAPLREGQLINYINAGTDTLVAITKNWPEITRPRIVQIGANHLRWQDISRAISEISGHYGNEKFLCDNFLKYLEYEEMAYREDITVPCLKKVGEFLTKISNRRCPHFVPGTSFSIADTCLAVLADARRIAQEAEQRLQHCSNWGPGYFHGLDGSSPRHALGLEMFNKGRGLRSRLLCGLYFTENDASVSWCVQHLGSSVKRSRYVEEPISYFFSDRTGALDADLLAKSVVTAVRKWKPI